MTKTGIAQLSSATVIVMLTCDHSLVFTRSHQPKVSEILYCHRCQDMRKIVSANAQYTIKCDECRYGRRCGASKETAHEYAAKHTRTKGHTVKIMLDGKVVGTSDIPAGQTALRVD